MEYEVVRTTLIPGALKTLAFNKSMSHKEGIKLFEISDIVVPAGTCAANWRCVCFLLLCVGLAAMS
jgi:phenylalanyl-tRNA synthetase beta subunit